MINLFYFTSNNLQGKWKIGGFHYAIKKCCYSYFSSFILFSKEYQHTLFNKVKIIQLIINYI